MPAAPHAPAICLLGPTAAGKTALAVELVQRLPLEIISVDSAQIYRDMDIGTGKPDAATLAAAPHRLINMLDPAERYSAAAFRSDALREMRQIRARGNVPLLVGGTMLYFKALRDGLSVLPAADAAIRADIDRMAAEQGWPAVHERLAAVDPASAGRIHPNDPQRLQRALEVYLLSGRSLSELQADSAGRVAPPPLRFIAVQPAQRHILHEKIADRFHAMLKAGLVEEVERLRARGDLHAGLPAIRSVGYRQVWQYLAGEMNYEAMTERGIIATRQLAKRQVTWMRSWQALTSFDSEDPNTPDKVLKMLQSSLI